MGQWTVRADEILAPLWSSPGAGDGPGAERYMDFLLWSFDKSPLAGSRYLVGRYRDGGLHAWFACETREHGLHVLDVRSRRGADGPSRTAVAILLRSARADGHASVSVELSAAAATGAWPALGFLAREARPVFGRWSGTQEEALEMRLDRESTRLNS